MHMTTPDRHTEVLHSYSQPRPTGTRETWLEYGFPESSGPDTGTYRTESPQCLTGSSILTSTPITGYSTGSENSPSVWTSFHYLQIPSISAYIAGVLIGWFVYLRGLSSLVVVPGFAFSAYINCHLPVWNNAGYYCQFVNSR